MRRFRSQMGTMGTECQPGYYDLKVFGVSTGQCVPNLSTLTAGAQAGAAESLATGIASSPTNIQAASTAGAAAVGSKIVGVFYDPMTRQVKWIPVGIALGVVAVAVYGSLSLLRGK